MQYQVLKTELLLKKFRTWDLPLTIGSFTMGSREVSKERIHLKRLCAFQCLLTNYCNCLQEFVPAEK